MVDPPPGLYDDRDGMDGRGRAQEEDVQGIDESRLVLGLFELVPKEVNA